MIKEIRMATLFSQDPGPVETVYFGGGTPSLLTPGELQQLFTALHRKFRISEDAEITFEANPDDITPDILDQWKKLGINRLSLGVQSFRENELEWMNRAHHAVESKDCIQRIRDAGFSNFSADLIYGSPLCADDDLKYNLDVLFEAGVPHVSCYALTVEPKTALDNMIRQHRSQPVDPEKQAGQFLLLMDLMNSNGYEHYEISNFSVPGMRSLHNSSYWQGKAYYGFGLSAHSFDGTGTRRWNVANNSLYIQSLQKGLVPFEEEVLTPVQQLNEYIMISLRTIEGLDMQLIQKRFGSGYAEQLDSSAKKHIDSGKLFTAESRLKLTREGKLFADGIAADLFF